MYQYEYVSVNYENKLAKNELQSHREIIDRYARDGWRFVSAIPTMNSGYGIISRVDLVFEKEI